MQLLNQVTLIGRISTELKIKDIPNGYKICDFILAINEKNKTSFIACTVMGDIAISLKKYMSKGGLISVIGKLNSDYYRDKHCNKKYSFKVQVTRIIYLDSKAFNDNRKNNNFDHDDDNDDDDDELELYDNLYGDDDSN